MKAAEFSVKYTFLLNMLAVFVIIAGVSALFRIPREAFPNIQFDKVLVETKYPGATAEQIETLITIPLEREMKEVDDIKEMESTSAEGISIISLTLEPDAKNKDKIVNDIQRAVDRTDDLPNDLIDQPIVNELQTKHEPVMHIAVSAPFSQLDLQNWGKRLEDRLLDIPDISMVKRQGYYKPQFHVAIDSQKLIDFHISQGQVGKALARHNITIPGGTLIDPSGEILLRTSGEFTSVEAINHVVVRASDQGHAVTVGDIAEVSLDHERPETRYRADGERAMLLLPLKKEKTDIFKLKKEVVKTIDGFKKIAPSELKIAIVHDFSYYVARRLNTLKWNGLIGFVLVAIALFLFLSPSAATGALLGMPATLLATFAIMHFFGITLNLLSMFGLIIVIGMLVDEDIVVAENIHRLRQEGKSPLEAIMQGTKEVAKSVVATVLTTITAFIPLLLMTGIPGKFVRNIPATVIITLLVSLMEALFLLPAHIAALSKRDTSRKNTTPFHATFFSRAIIDRYDRLLRTLIRRRYLTLFGFLCSLALTMGIWAHQGKIIMFPKRGIEAFFIRAETKKGSPLQVTEEKMKILEDRLSVLPSTELDHFITELGIIQNDPRDPLTLRGSHLGQIRVHLTPESKRKRNALEIMDSLRPYFQDAEGFEKIWLDSVNPGPPMGKPVAIRLKGESFAHLEQHADRVLALLADIPGVSDSRDDYEPGKREKQVLVDPVRAAQSGLSVKEIAEAVHVAFDGGVVTAVRTSDELEDVVVKFPESSRYDPNALSDVMIANERGQLIPITQVARIVEKNSIEHIRHFDRKRTITVTAEVDERVTSSTEVNATLRHRLQSEFNRDPSLSVHYGGEVEDTARSMASLFRAFGLALFLTFIIVAATLGSVIAPFVVMSTIVLGLMGVIIGFFLAGHPLSFLGMIGIVAMAGVVVDGALLIVDFIHKKDAEGLPPHEAIIEGAKRRLRPIFLTALTTILGIIPTSLGLGGSDPFIQPMALALNWGIGFGTLASVFLTPVLIAITRDIKLKVTRL